MQETSQIRWLMYFKSAICERGQFEFDSVINWKPNCEHYQMGIYHFQEI